MPSLAEQHKHLRLNNEIKPLLHRYGIPYDKKANKESLLALLQANGVPLDRVQQSATAPDLSAVEVLGLEQIARDYPPLGSDESSGGGLDEDSAGGMEEDSAGGMEEDSAGGMDEDSAGGRDEDSSPGLGSDSTSATTRSVKRLVDLPDHKGHAGRARQAGIPDPANKLTDLERRLLLEYPAASACLPTIKRGLGQANLKQKVTGLVDWFASVAKSQNMPVGPALVFFDSYLSSPNLDFVAYLLDKDGCRESWYAHSSNPNARKQAAKRLGNLWSLALDSPEATTTATASSDPTADQDFFMEVIDPYDGMPTRGKVIGLHMSKKDTLGVRLPSLSEQYPDLGRGLWVECKSGKELEAYKAYVKAFPKGKLSSAPAGFLAGCQTTADFHLDRVFRMKWGRGYHTYAYGRPKNGDFRHLMMFTKTTLSPKLKGAAAVMEMLQTHMERTGQSTYEGTDDAQPEVIRLRARRSVTVQ
ncbi:hypothetical protein C8A01DRAFT_39448 [Parachaetomium inaequale]|uniref:Uncharacterized protein n=1 Tax=Parachaetomium inaequale TaxID=2588326 RepID=A0AAN6P988_9PEZI|nr:hypothetical protein C8A01DRAFT_39448 [Parachaetomium inaequale]